VALALVRFVAEEPEAPEELDEPPQPVPNSVAATAAARAPARVGLITATP
jgi:hypothetical protein